MEHSGFDPKHGQGTRMVTAIAKIPLMCDLHELQRGMARARTVGVWAADSISITKTATLWVSWALNFYGSRSTVTQGRSLNRVWDDEGDPETDNGGESADPDMRNLATCLTNSRKSCSKVPISACYGPRYFAKHQKCQSRQESYDLISGAEALNVGQFHLLPGIFGMSADIFDYHDLGGVAINVLQYIGSTHNKELSG